MSAKSSLAATLAAVVGFFCGASLIAQNEAPPAPPGCHWQPIAAVKVIWRSPTAGCIARPVKATRPPTK